ncbi:MAG: putative toxin-antitoxin system toxin component, PIN family [Sulfuritalea sp.]|nr:putative toxin-antitoxin system toxin component, PIN family [Sulfuritalea sp.]MDP1981010.1 putative toxin-antitoxin system toxin component, PIN family [Sulfuritalea sp.]
MRLVVDTNVVISALLWGGTPKALFALGETHDISFHTSRALLDEMADVLSRKKLAKTIAAIDATQDDKGSCSDLFSWHRMLTKSRRWRHGGSRSRRIRIHAS